MYNRRIRIDKVLSFSVIDKESGEVLLNYPKDDEKCPLFDFCNCKTAACRALIPDESCYWYRYFKNLIEKNERKI